MYAGFEAFGLVLAPDFRSRDAWTAFSAGGPHASTGTGVAVRSAALALGATADNGTTAFVTASPFQASRGAGAEGYVVVRDGGTVGADATPASGPMLVVDGSPARNAFHVRVASDVPGRVDVFGLAPGSYWVRLTTASGRAARLVVVVR